MPPATYQVQDEAPVYVLPPAQVSCVLPEQIAFHTLDDPRAYESRLRLAPNLRPHADMILSGRIPLEKLFSGKGDLLVYQEHVPTSSLRANPFTSALDQPLLVSLPGHPHAGPDPRWKIPPSEWGTVIQRVEQGEPLRHIARDYGVSYEAIRRVLRAARRRQAGRVSTVHLPSQ